MTKIIPLALLPSLPALLVVFAFCRSVLEALASSLRRFFKDVLIFTGPIWLPTDAASFLPSVSGDPLPRNIDPSGSSKQVYACLRLASS